MMSFEVLPSSPGGKIAAVLALIIFIAAFAVTVSVNTANPLIGALLFLVSPEASGFVTGIIIPVDGGFSAYSGV